MKLDCHMRLFHIQHCKGEEYKFKLVCHYCLGIKLALRQRLLIYIFWGIETDISSLK